MMSYEIKANSPLEAILKKALQATIEMGYFRHCERTTFTFFHAFTRINRTNAYSIDAPDVVIFSSVTFDMILPFFYLFGFGIVVAILTFIAEIVYSKYNRKSTNGPNNCRIRPVKKNTTQRIVQLEKKSNRRVHFSQ